MGLHERYPGYESFSYLEAGRDYRPFQLADQLDRVPASPVPLTPGQEARVSSLVERCLFVSMHEHAGVFPARI
jgi:membrane dipeptidase